MEMQAAPGRIRNMSCFRARLLRQLVFCSVTKWLKFTSPYVSHSGNMTFPFSSPAAPQTAVENTCLVYEICGQHKLFAPAAVINWA